MTVFQSSRRRTFFACLFLIVATLAVYWPAHHYGFVEYDDDNYVYDNQMVRSGLTWQGVEWSLVDRQANNWHPLTWLSHMADCQIFGLNAGAAHLENVFFHCANAVLLLLLLQTTTGAFWRSAFVAALFALHPLRVESVAWISERKDVLSGFFFLLALWTYVLYAKGKNLLQSDEAKNGCKKNYNLSLAFFLLGLLAKPMLVTMPLVLLLMDFWPLQRCNTSTLQRLLAEKWPFFLLAAVFCAITLLAQRPGLPAQNFGIFQRFETITFNYFDYIAKLLWPQNLSFLYLRPEKIPFGEFLQAALVLLSISALVFAGRRRCPALATGWLWFLLMLLPVSGIVSLGRLSIADRYTYLPSIGFYIMATWAFADFIGKLFPVRTNQIFLAISGAVVLAVCAVLSRQQLGCWQNTETLMEHALKMDPDNYVAKIDLHIYRFEISHPGIRPPPPDSSSAGSTSGALK